MSGVHLLRSSTERNGDPTPCIPEYRGANVCGIVPGLLGRRNAIGCLRLLPTLAVVVLVLDGLGWRQLEQRANVAGVEFPRRRADFHGRSEHDSHCAVIDSNGLTPAEHGILGYRMLRSQTNMLRWAVGGGFVDMMYRLENFSFARAFCGQRVPYVTSQELIGSSFSDAHLFGGVAHGYRRRLLCGGRF